jgi:hypothetical protein
MLHRGRGGPARHTPRREPHLTLALSAADFYRSSWWPSRCFGREIDVIELDQQVGHQ